MNWQPPNSTKSFALGIAGALAGAVIGHFAFLWIARQGFYALALPGAVMGWGCGFLAKSRSLPLAVLCGALALAVGIFSEWRFAPFIKDGSFGYFVTHLQDLRPVTLLMLALGAGCGFWFARGSAGAGSVR